MVLLKELLPPSRKTGAGKKLRVFDFDDTLAKVDSWVYIKQPDGKEKKLDSAEYAVYKLKPGETEDFRDDMDWTIGRDERLFNAEVRGAEEHLFREAIKRMQQAV